MIREARTLACCLVFAGSLGCSKKSDSHVESDQQHASISIGETVVAKPTELEVTAPSDLATIPSDARKSPSGLAWVVFREGTGEDHPGDNDVVIVNFVGWTADGGLVDESISGGRPAAIPVRYLFPGLSEAVKRMVVGERTRFWIPRELGLSKAQTGNPTGAVEAPSGAVVYDVELLSFATPPPARDAAEPTAKD
jgi:peptidylprolyl isomerase